MSVMIGIDPAKGSHAAAAVNGSEEAVAELEVRASRRQTSELLAWAEQFPQRKWAIESANGHGYLLAQQLVATGEFVVDVPSTLSARVRVLDSTRSQKNDANDARSVAIVALRQPNLRVVTAEDHLAVLRMLAKRHKQLASLKTQAAARLHTVLAALIPGGLGKEMVVRQAAELLRRIRPASMTSRERTQSVKGKPGHRSGSIGHHPYRHLRRGPGRSRPGDRLQRRHHQVPHPAPLRHLQRHRPHRRLLRVEEAASAQPARQPHVEPCAASDRDHPTPLPGN